MEIERCCVCDEETGRAGRSDDSIYIDDYGPLCSDCNFVLTDSNYVKEFKAKIEQLETDLADQHNHWTKIMNENDAKIQQLEEENERLKDIINDLSEDCPNCNNMGSYAGGNEETGVEQIQCQWCYEVPNSKFNLQKALEEQNGLYRNTR